VALAETRPGPDARGDHKTPEGEVHADHRNAHSQFYHSIHISYPNARDRARARRLGVAPGGDVMLHGLTDGYGWMGAESGTGLTDGCMRSQPRNGSNSGTPYRRHSIEIRPRDSGALALSVAPVAPWQRYH